MDPTSRRAKAGALPPAASSPKLPAEVVRQGPAPGPENASDFFSMGSTRVIQADLANEAEATLLQEDTPLSSAKPKEISVLGDYQLLKKIGQGAMGAVYRAKQLQSDRPVALKVLFPHVAGNPKLVERLRREGLVMGQLDHPNLVTAYGNGVDQGWHYIAMEYVEGESLQKWIDRLGRLTIGDALAIALSSAAALEYAHRLGFVHRDVKPENILITSAGEIKVTDLGMVKTPDEDMSLTQTGHAVGTPWYMPLEQARNAKDTDGRCDIYALGCMLYCMITGHPPFTGKTLVDVIQAKEGGTFPAARHYNAEVPERLDLILVKMTAKLPRYRYANCSELITDLESLGLANKNLSFLESEPATAAGEETFSQLGDDSSSDITTDDWYLRVLQPDGKIGVRKLATAQLKKMLAEGTVEPTAHVSRRAEGGFRAVGTFKQFQSTALGKQSRRAADLQSARYRNLYRKIEEKERVRDQAEKQQPEESLPDLSNLWLPAVMIAGAFVLLVLLWYFLANLI